MSITVHIKSGQNKWDVAIDPSSTIAQFKSAIAAQSEIAPENQRLIYSGKILKDDQTVESYKILDDHSVHLVKSGGSKKATSPGATAAASGDATAAGATSTPAAQPQQSAPANLSTGQGGGFNPLSDLTSARYAGFLNLPSADSFGPDGGMTSAPNSDDVLRMLENPVMQSQMNEMLSNPQMIDFLIQQSPQLQSMGPQARTLLQSPFFRQMMTNPDMIRQSMQFSSMLGGDSAAGGGSSFPAPGTPAEADAPSQPAANPSAAPSAGTANPFASLLGGQAGASGASPAANPFLSMLGGGSAGTPPALDPMVLSSILGGAGAANQQPQDTRPPEERYEHQLRQLNDMGFFEFDRNVAALRRSGGSVQGALDALLNGDV